MDMLFLGEFDDQDAVLRRQRDQHDQTDLGIKVQRQAGHDQTDEGSGRAGAHR
jgi:hypothetical protein